MTDQSSESKTRNPEPLLDWIDVNSVDGNIETEFLSDLFELLNRATFTDNVSAEIFHDQKCREFPKEIPAIAKEKIQRIAIGSLFDLAILRLIRTPACGTACLLALQTVTPENRRLVHQIVSAINIIRTACPELFSQGPMDVLKTEMERLDLSWETEFDRIDQSKIDI